MSAVKIKEAIKKSGLSQKHIAAELGMSVSTFRRKMNNNTFGVIEAENITAMLGVDNPLEIFFAD